MIWKEKVIIIIAHSHRNIMKNSYNIVSHLMINQVIWKQVNIIFHNLNTKWKTIWTIKQFLSFSSLDTLQIILHTIDYIISELKISYYYETIMISKLNLSNHKKLFTRNDEQQQQQKKTSKKEMKKNSWTFFPRW